MESITNYTCLLNELLKIQTLSFRENYKIIV